MKNLKFWALGAIIATISILVVVNIPPPGQAPIANDPSVLAIEGRVKFVNETRANLLYTANGDPYTADTDYFLKFDQAILQGILEPTVTWSVPFYPAGDSGYYTFIKFTQVRATETELTEWMETSLRNAAGDSFIVYCEQWQNPGRMYYLFEDQAGHWWMNQIAAPEYQTPIYERENVLRNIESLYVAS